MRKLIVALFFFCGLVAMVCAGEEEIEKALMASQWVEQQVTTPDGIILKGQVNEQKDASALVVLLHMLGKTWETWKPLTPDLKKAGYSVFAYDTRGHGASTTTKDGKAVSYRDFAAKGKDNEWNKMPGDLRAVVESLRSKSESAKKSIVLIGASIGANAALNYAAEDKDIAAVVLLSPGLNYHDVEIEEAAKKIGTRPVLIVAGMMDEYSYQSSQKLEQIIKSANPEAKVKLLVDPTKSHGTELLNILTNGEIIKWLGNSLQKPEAAKTQ